MALLSKRPIVFIGNVQFWLTLWQFCPLDGVFTLKKSRKISWNFVYIQSTHYRTFVYICQPISAICLHLSAVCSQFQLFVYNFRYLFTISAVCLQFQLFVYICQLFAYFFVSWFSAVCLQFEFSRQIEFFILTRFFTEKYKSPFDAI